MIGVLVGLVLLVSHASYQIRQFKRVKALVAAASQRRSERPNLRACLRRPLVELVAESRRTLLAQLRRLLLRDRGGILHLR